ncbi:MAG: hypothetical protein HKO02_01395 [Hyphomonadaceae bacterium]|nr:hypothetical protein [Hyphomonadaceae bacterium]
MKRFLKIAAVLFVLLIGMVVLKTCDFGPPPPRPDLDLPLAPQMADPTSAPMDMNFPAVNPMAAQGVNPIPHGDPAQQDSTPLPGPLDKTRRLEDHEIAYQFLGPGHFGAFTSGEYADGRRVLWTNGVNGVFKLDYETYELIDHLPSDVADKWNEEWANKIIAKLDKNNGASALPTAVKSMMPLKSLSGVYTVVGANDWFYLAKKDGSIVAYGDETQGDAGSKIVEKEVFKLPADIAGASVGMNMTYDGWIVFPMEKGTIVAVSPDLTEYRSVRLKHADTEDTETRGVGYGWVRNSIAIDEEGGIYVASRNHMHKVVWTGDALSVDPADGAWTAAYRNGTEEGTGATPSLMGFGDEDRFVVITDGDIRMNVVLMWRDAIPEEWQQIDGAPSRRIAGQAPADMGNLKVQEIQTEQTVIVAGYGALVVNNTPRNTPFFMPNEGVGRGATIGPLGNNPKFQPYGVQKFEWNPNKRRLEKAWVNETISSPNGVPWVSTGSGQVYFIGARDNEWTLEAVNWLTGEPTFHYIMGAQKYNNMFSGPTIDEKGRVFVGAYYGRMRIQPDP